MTASTTAPTSPTTERTWNTTRFRLADLISRTAAGEGAPSQPLLAAVARLTASADPARAERLRPRPGEPTVLIERLAMWALPRADDDAVADAHALLADAPVTVAC